jgi:hypothetical protein
MAIMSNGRVVVRGHPLELVAALKGRIWKKFVPVDELERIQQELQLIAVRRVAGKRLVHVYAEERPAEGFDPAEPDLEDVYFNAIRAAKEPS